MKGRTKKKTLLGARGQVFSVPLWKSFGLLHRKRREKSGEKGEGKQGQKKEDNRGR